MISALRNTHVYQTLKRVKAAGKRTPAYAGIRRLVIPIRRSRPYQTIRHFWKLLWVPEYRANDQKARDDFRVFCQENGGLGLRSDVRPRNSKSKTALIVSVTLPYVSTEAFVKKAFQMAGFETIVVGVRRYEFLRYDWLAGSKPLVTFDDYHTDGDPAWVDRQVNELKTLNEWVSLEYQGVHVGRFVIALAQRNYRGRLDFADDATQAELRRLLNRSVRYTITAGRMLREIKPDCVLVMDRGYSGHGELFDLAIAQGIDTMTWNLGYKSDRLLFKRYHRGNERDHPLSPSTESWQQIRSIPWSLEKGNKVRQELFSCYATQDWFSMVGTQFDKQILSQEKTREKLGLTSEKKVAVIFPHILWDGSFFWGKDLFSDYTEWFVETMRAAAANPRLQWIVKLHPAHLVKARQNNDSARPLEFDVIEKAVGPLPDHIRLIHPESDVSTYSLFQVADYAVTVRGTVGIESALFGIPVVTAGTGRYDRRGFTLDSSTRDEYLQKLATLETYAPLSTEQVEMAERYAYGMFFGRPVSLSSLSLEYARDGKATPKVRVHCQSREDWLAAPDMQTIASWLSDGKLEDMLELPTVPDGGAVLPARTVLEPVEMVG